MYEDKERVIKITGKAKWGIRMMRGCSALLFNAKDARKRLQKAVSRLWCFA